jgi:hypothetical protein
MFYFKGEYYFNLITSKYWTRSEPFIHYNFGILDFDLSSTSSEKDKNLKVKMRTIDYKGNEVLYKEFLIDKDMKFDEKNLRYPLVCLAMNRD